MAVDMAQADLDTHAGCGADYRATKSLESACHHDAVGRFALLSDLQRLAAQMVIQRLQLGNRVDLFQRHTPYFLTTRIRRSLLDPSTALHVGTGGNSVITEMRGVCRGRSIPAKPLRPTLRRYVVGGDWWGARRQ